MRYAIPAISRFAVLVRACVTEIGLSVTVGVLPRFVPIHDLPPRGSTEDVADRPFVGKPA